MIINLIVFIKEYNLILQPNLLLSEGTSLLSVYNAAVQTVILYHYLVTLVSGVLCGNIRLVQLPNVEADPAF